jgi:hypothetical protein
MTDYRWLASFLVPVAFIHFDPSFDLRENEAGNPTWGPVFRSVKAKK